jgi:hypothetical protein
MATHESAAATTIGWGGAMTTLGTGTGEGEGGTFTLGCSGPTCSFFEQPGARSARQSVVERALRKCVFMGYSYGCPAF